MKEKLVGKYKHFKIEKRGDVLICIVAQRLLELVPVSKTEFVFRKTAGSLIFSQGEDGELDEAYLTVDAMGRTKVSKIREAETKESAVD